MIYTLIRLESNDRDAAVLSTVNSLSVNSIRYYSSTYTAMKTRYFYNPYSSIINCYISANTSYLCRDSSCACFQVLGINRYGRILKIYCIHFADETVKPIVILHVKFYQKINDIRHRFKYNFLLAKREERATEKYMNVTDLCFKCIFLSHSKLPKVNGQDIYIACRLMNHALDGQNQAFWNKYTYVDRLLLLLIVYMIYLCACFLLSI